MTAELDPAAKEARRQYRLMARSLEIDGLLAQTRNMPLSSRYCRQWAARLRKLAMIESAVVGER